MVEIEVEKNAIEIFQKGIDLVAFYGTNLTVFI